MPWVDGRRWGCSEGLKTDFGGMDRLLTEQSRAGLDHQPLKIDNKQK